MGTLRFREVQELTWNYPDKKQPLAWFLFSDATLGTSHLCARSYAALHEVPQHPKLPCISYTNRGDAEVSCILVQE